MKIRALEALCFAQRLQHPPLESGGLRTFEDSEPRRGPFGPSGELGPRARGLDFEAGADSDQRAK
eukprot:4140287-Alexandrium_andersonii.AAC.1